MEKETVLAKFRASIHFSENTLMWFEKVHHHNPDAWFASQRGTTFMSEHREIWDRVLVKSTESTVQSYFSKIGVPENRLPHVKVYESYAGSWIMEAAIVMFSSIGGTYALFKGISELPKIADGLTELKGRLKKEFTREISPAVNSELNQIASRFNEPPPPQNPLNIDFMIDARPILSLTPSIMKSHKIHLNVAISRDSFCLENLGEELMRDIRIGLFKSTSPRNQWSFTDSYMGTVNILSSGQTITKDVSEFEAQNRTRLNLSDYSDLYVDCWVQDSHGIYLFNFFLEK